MNARVTEGETVSERTLDKSAGRGLVVTRVFVVTVVLAGLSLTPGCAWSRFGQHNAQTAPVSTNMQSASKEELVAHINQNIAKTPRWRCTDVRISAHGRLGLGMQLSAMLAVEEPKNFRLVAHSAGGLTEVDLGSNEERFWFYVRQADQPGVYTAKHEQTEEAMKYLPLPIQPEWFAEALGVIPLNAEEVELKPHEKNPRLAYLVSTRQNGGQKPVQLVSVVDKSRGLIMEQRLSSPKGEVIATARMSNHKQHPESGAVIPYQVDINWPQAKMGMTMVLGRVDIDDTPFASQTFDMPQLKNAPVRELGGGVPARPEAPVQKTKHREKKSAKRDEWGEEDEPADRPMKGARREARERDERDDVSPFE
ncbi:MAG: hypothetical protein U0903_02345 [Planctomycetales bacterium]